MKKFRLYRDLNQIRNRHIKPVVVKVVPTWKCQLDCDYCSRHFIGKTYHHARELQVSSKAWLNIIYDFPIPIDIVYITGGGEPFLYYEIQELIYSLIQHKYCVKIFSNLQKAIQLPVSGRLVISTTLHKSGNLERQWENINHYRSLGIEVEVFEFDESMPSDFTATYDDIGKKGIIKLGTPGMYQCLNYPVFNFTPDGMLFTDQGTAWRHYKLNGALT